MQNRAEAIELTFLQRVREGNLPNAESQVTLAEAEMTPRQLQTLFESQLSSRLLDLCSRRLQARGESFYTIGSAGHEGNAAIAEAFRPNDLALLHYRDAAFQIQRARQLPGQTPIWDLLLSFCACAEDPISGGRHKVLGSRSLWIPPQTSTIASHLPKAVGAAFSIPLSKRMHRNAQATLPTDSVVLCSFGDASVNHSTAQGAFNTAAWIAYQQTPLPLVFICEDNGIGISTPTPKGWIAASCSRRPGLQYLYCDGLNLLDTYRTARRASRLARHHQQPVFLHMNCVRMLGHAGSDAETAYHHVAEIEATEARDPLLHSARLLIENGIYSSDQIIDRYQTLKEEIDATAERATRRPKLKTATEVRAALLPTQQKPSPSVQIMDVERERVFGREHTLMGQPQHLSKLLNWALTDLMLSYPEIVLAGEDIGPKGGVYNVTGKLAQRFGHHRVINTLLDEQSILGLAIGLAHNGLLPIPEIQFLAYIHNAEDQLRGEAATLSFFSNGQYSNPMVIRIAGLPYQKGFGGHFHNDNSLAVFRDVPGLIIACPSNGHDAVLMLRESVRLAREEGRVVVFIEPIARYMTRDLVEEGDGQWTYHYPPPHTEQQIRLGKHHQEGWGTELCLLSYGNGYYLCRQVAEQLKDQHGIKLRLIDLRWLAPLDETALLAAITPCSHLLIVDECRRSGSISEALVTLIIEKAATTPRLKRITAEDCFIPLGPAYAATLPSKARILEAALLLLGK